MLDVKGRVVSSSFFVDIIIELRLIKFMFSRFFNFWFNYTANHEKRFFEYLLFLFIYYILLRIVLSELTDQIWLWLKQKLNKASCTAVLSLAYQSLGVVYGDLSTSPLYVYKTTFSGKPSLHEDDEEIYGVLSFIFWTFTLIALLKYVLIVMSADDNGEGI